MTDQMPKMPPSFKAVLPFIRRAEELDRDSSRPESKLIAYFCRQYAMELGIKVRENDTSNEATEYLLALMDRLEDDKSKLPAFTQEEGKEICEDFALEIFSKADDEDRAGSADKNTARTFYAAGTFFDILNQFGDISEAITEKRKYCKYKAAMILKAIKEGRVPTPGPPEGMDTGEGGDDLASSGMSLASSGMSFPSAPVAAPAPEPTPPPVAARKYPFVAATYVDFEPSDATFYLCRCGFNVTTARPDPYVPAPEPPAYTPPPQVTAPPSAPRRNDPTDFPSFTQTAGSTGPASAAPPAHTNTWTPPAHTPPAPAPVHTPSAPAPAPALAPAPVHQYSNHIPSAPTYTPAPQPPPTAYAAPSVPARSRNGPVSQNEINDAIECAKFAIAALKVKDIELAVQRLETALRSIR